MVRSIKWALTLVAALMLVACDGGFETDDDTTDDSGGSGDLDNGSSDEVTLAVGSGSGSSFQSGQLSVDEAGTLVAGGNTAISVTVVNAETNQLYVGDTSTAVFSSNCASSSTPSASFSPASDTGQGLLETTYTASGCVGTDLLTATVTVGGEVVGTASATLNIAAIDVGTIESNQPDPSTIALKGFGTDTLPSTSTITFVVKNKQGNAVPNQDVRFSIPNNIGGIELTKTSGKTNSSGEVSAIAQGGTVNTIFRIIAETDITDDTGAVTGTVFTQSKPITVNTGLPNFAGFGLATEIFNPHAWGHINTEVGITVTASDFHNGPVPDGTAITFVTSGGQIQASGRDIASCEIAEGDCSVKWESGPPYPATGGTMVMGHVIGEESFIDENGNSLYDIGETFIALPEPYLDANDNGAYDSGEFFVDVDQDGVWDDVDASPKYKGASCSEAAIADGHCAEMAYLFDSVPMIMSSAIVSFEQTPAGVVDVSSGSATIFVEMSDENNNIPPVGTPVAFSCLGDVEIQGSKPDQVPNAYILGAGYTWSITIKNPEDIPDGDPTDGEADICYMEVDTVDGGYSAWAIDVVY